MRKNYFLLMLAGFLLPNAQAQTGIWSDPINVSHNTGPSKCQDIAVDNSNRIHMAWQDNTASGGTNGDILYSFFYGLTWSSPSPISASGVYSYIPKIANDIFDRPHVVWTDHGSTNPHIFYSFRQDSVWTNPTNLSFGAYGNFYPDIAIDTNNEVHVVWHGIISGFWHILYRHFDGNQWLPPEDLTPNPWECGFPRIVSDAQNRLHLTWIDHVSTLFSQKVMYSCKDENGWSSPVLISMNFNYNAEDPDISVDENAFAHIVWRQVLLPGPQSDIYYSSFNGVVWSNPLNVSNTGGQCFNPSIASSIRMTGVSFSISPPTVNSHFLFVSCVDGSWSELDTLFVNPPNSYCKAALAFDVNSHLQIVSSPYCSGGSHELFHQTYIDDSGMLPADLMPNSTPIIIPRAGGSFVFAGKVTNNAALPVTFDVWVDAVLPDGRIYGPILIRRNLNLAPRDSLLRANMTQYVPGNAPVGLYYYRLQVGDFSNGTIVSADSFDFMKEGTAPGSDNIWQLTGWDKGFAHSDSGYSDSGLGFDCSPNPFNPTTTIRYDLPEGGRALLRVYDVTGKFIATLLDGYREAGSHELTFDASGLSSGIYLYRLQAGSFAASGKMVLMK